MSMPTVFVSHGSPMLILEDRPARAFLASLGQLAAAAQGHHRRVGPLGHRRAGRVDGAQARHHPRFLRLPRSALRLRYDPPGAPELAERVAKLTGAAHDPHRGLDHGAWVPAKLAWPEADIPIFQLSVQPD